MNGRRLSRTESPLESAHQPVHDSRPVRSIYLGMWRRPPRARGASLDKRGGLRSSCLPAIVGERLVRFGHAVRVFLLLHRIALALRRRDHLGGELFRHRLLVAVTRIADEPTHRERGPALRADFDRNLVRGAADSAALDLDHGLQVGQRLLEHVHARLAGARLDHVHRTVEHPLRSRLLALKHQGIDELRDRLAVVARVRKHWTLYGFLTAAHFLPPAAPALGRLVPYLERLWLRPFTPEASSVPRTIW